MLLSMTGQTISHYKILEKLGEGGMGVVYKATDTKLERTVALKFLASDRLEDEEHKARFRREARAAAALDHPNICTVYEIDEAQGQTFLAMPYLEGLTVRQKVKQRPLKLDEALDIAIQAGEGLRAAHAKGIVHRDIKSANLMVSPQGQVKVMDFGLAQAADQSLLTKTETLLGTPVYMSPEQAQRLPTDRRTDIWSLGIVIYEMLIGAPRLRESGSRRCCTGSSRKSRSRSPANERGCRWIWTGLSRRRWPRTRTSATSTSTRCWSICGPSRGRLRKKATPAGRARDQPRRCSGKLRHEPGEGA